VHSKHLMQSSSLMLLFCFAYSATGTPIGQGFWHILQFTHSPSIRILT